METLGGDTGVGEGDLAGVVTDAEDDVVDEEDRTADGVAEGSAVVLGVVVIICL